MLKIDYPLKNTTVFSMRSLAIFCLLSCSTCDPSEHNRDPREEEQRRHSTDQVTARKQEEKTASLGPQSIQN